MDGSLGTARKRAGTIFCDEAKQYLQELEVTIRELVQLHEAQFKAVIAGDADSKRLDSLINAANERKNAAKQAYIQHTQEHGCSKANSEEAKKP